MKLELQLGDAAFTLVIAMMLFYLLERERQRQQAVYFIRNNQGKYEVPEMGVTLNYGGGRSWN